MSCYKKYDVTAKVTLIEEFLDRKQSGEKLTIVKFCHEKCIPKTTFHDWLTKYRNDRNNFIYGSDNNDTVDLTLARKPTFIEISKDKLIDNAASLISPSNVVKLNYKDASLEFGVSELDKVMEILRRW